MKETEKQVQELTFLDGISYHKEHTWAKVEGDQVRIGISDFAQDQLGDIIFVELPQVGDSFARGEIFGQAESAKTVSSLHMPLSGEVLAINNEVEDSPETLNSDPYGAGWLIVIKESDLSEVNTLLDKDGYINLLKA
jgi:glycine cleavage system H protein